MTNPVPRGPCPCIGRRSQVSLLHAAATDVSEDEMNLKIEKRQVDGVSVVSCQGRIMFGDEANASARFSETGFGETPRMVLNLSGVTYIDSGGLGTLVGVLFCPLARLAPKSRSRAWASACTTCCRLPSWQRFSRRLIVSRRPWPQSAGGPLELFGSKLSWLPLRDGKTEIELPACRSRFS